MDEGFPLECAQDANTLRRMKKSDLVELAKDYGLDQGGLKDTLVQRISEWAARQVWLQSTGQVEAMDQQQQQQQQQQQPGPLKRIASSLGFSSFSANSNSASSGDVSMDDQPSIKPIAAAAPMPAAGSPDSDYTRRYSFLPEDSLDVVVAAEMEDDQDASGYDDAPDARPAIRSIPSKLSLDLLDTTRSQANNMLLDDQLDTARASTIFGGGSNNAAQQEVNNTTLEFGTRAVANQEFSFQRPAAAPAMPPPGPSLSGLFHAFMGSNDNNNKDKKPDRFAAAHDAQFSKMPSIGQSSAQSVKATQKRKREDDPDQPDTATTSSKRSLMSRSFESLRGKAKMTSKPAAAEPNSPEPQQASAAPSNSQEPSPAALSQPKKARKSVVAMAHAGHTAAPSNHAAAQLRKRLLHRQKARRRSSVPGERRPKSRRSVQTKLASAAAAPLPSYAQPTTAFQAKTHNVPSHRTWSSSISAKMKTSIPLHPQPPMNPRFGVARTSSSKKESNGAVVIGFAKSHPSAENGAPMSGGSENAAAPRFAAGTASSRAKAVGESPNKRQRLNTEKPLHMTPGRSASTRTRAGGATIRSGLSPRRDTRSTTSRSLPSRHQRSAAAFFPSGY